MFTLPNDEPATKSEKLSRTSRAGWRPFRPMRLFLYAFFRYAVALSSLAASLYPRYPTTWKLSKSRMGYSYCISKRQVGEVKRPKPGLHRRLAKESREISSLGPLLIALGAILACLCRHGSCRSPLLLPYRGRVMCPWPGTASRNVLGLGAPISLISVHFEAINDEPLAMLFLDNGAYQRTNAPKYGNTNQLM